MTEKEAKTRLKETRDRLKDIRIIAQFMDDEMQPYDKNWKSLMPVVQKISKLRHTWIQIIPLTLGFPRKSYCYIEYGFFKAKEFKSEGNCFITVVFKTVVKFLKYYNKIKDKYV